MTTHDLSPQNTTHLSHEFPPSTYIYNIDEDCTICFTSSSRSPPLNFFTKSHDALVLHGAQSPSLHSTAEQPEDFSFSFSKCYHAIKCSDAIVGPIILSFYCDIIICWNLIAPLEVWMLQSPAIVSHNQFQYTLLSRKTSLRSRLLSNTSWNHMFRFIIRQIFYTSNLKTLFVSMDCLTASPLDPPMAWLNCVIRAPISGSCSKPLLAFSGNRCGLKVRSTTPTWTSCKPNKHCGKISLQ